MKRQQGFGGVFILFVIVMCFFSFLTFLKVFPFYTDDAVIESVLDGLKLESEQKEYNRTQIEDMIQKRFEINDLSELVESVDVSGQGSKIIIDMEYERRVSLISNIEIVATFNHYIDFSE